MKVASCYSRQIPKWGMDQMWVFALHCRSSAEEMFWWEGGSFKALIQALRLTPSQTPHLQPMSLRLLYAICFFRILSSLKLLVSLLPSKADCYNFKRKGLKCFMQQFNVFWQCVYVLPGNLLTNSPLFFLAKILGYFVPQTKFSQVPKPQ